MTHDPVDAIKVEPPSEAELILSHISEMIVNGIEELNQSTTRSAQSSWNVELHSQRAQAWAQLANAQASYAIALQLRRLTDLLEEGLPEISKRLDEISNSIDLVPGAMPGS